VDVADSPESNLEHTLILSALNRRESTVHEGGDSEELGLADIHSGGHGLTVRQAREQVGYQHVGVDKIRLLGDDGGGQCAFYYRPKRYSLPDKS
jgi:hypothetical protein